MNSSTTVASDGVSAHLDDRAAAGAAADSWSSALTTVAAFGAATVAAVLVLFSLRWPLYHDLPIFLYEGYLMQELGRVPYRDFFEQNAPGTMLLSGFLHQITAGEALPTRIIDVFVLSGISAFTMLALRAHGLRSGVLASACFAIAYLAAGPNQSLQREYLCVLPLAMSIAIAFARSAPRSEWLSTAAIGLLAGLATTIKPPLLLCWAPLVLMRMVARYAESAFTVASLVKQSARVLVPFTAGLALPIVAAIVWMAQIGALASYLDIVSNYYPLYADLSGTGSVREAGALTDALRRYVFEPLPLVSAFRFAIASFIGVALAWSCRTRPVFVQCLILCGVAVCGLLYVAIGGKFWIYHRHPFYYALSLLAGLAVSRQLVRMRTEALWQNSVLCAALFIALPFAEMHKEYRMWQGGKTHDVKEGRVDMVAEYLATNTLPSQTVMPLDVTSGAVHALYRNRSPLYGRFIYDHHFYHHVDHPYIQGLRRQMIDQLGSQKPDIVVRFDDTWLRGDFPELNAILQRDYDMMLQRNDVSILRRKAALQ